MTSGETALVGKWFLKQRTAGGSDTYYNSPSIYEQFNNTYTTDNSGTTSRSGYTYTASSTGVGAYSTWVTNTSGDTLVFQSPSLTVMGDIKYKVVLITTDSLILQQNNTTTGVNLVYYFHK